MIFKKTNIIGAFIIDINKLGDERGFFARMWCKKEFEESGIKINMLQTNIAFSKYKGTLRGLHYQVKPFEEAKLVRCTKGSIFDVIVDLRPESSTYKKWIGVGLSEHNYKMLYVPEGCAHGYQTLEDNTELIYQVSQFYSPDHERGARYNDPSFGIEWPVDVRVISDKDKNWQDYTF